MQEPTCQAPIEPACSRLASKTGPNSGLRLCLTHHMQDWRGEQLRPIRVRGPQKGERGNPTAPQMPGPRQVPRLPKQRTWDHSPCKYEGCTLRNFRNGYCHEHLGMLEWGIPLQPLRQPRTDPAEGYHWCSHCKLYRPVEQFGRDTTRGNRPKRLCRPCANESTRKHTEHNRERLNKQRVLRRFGISEAEWDERYARQNGRCALCDGQRRGYRELAVDHDHVTGKIRALLCQDCNLGIGQLKDDPDLLERAAAYIRHHREIVARYEPIEDKL